MLFVCYGFDAPDRLQERLRVRDQHLLRVEALAREGRVVAAGPMLKNEKNDPLEAGFKGSLLIIEFPSHEEAQQWWDQDPYQQNHIFREAGVYPYLMFYPKSATD